MKEDVSLTQWAWWLQNNDGEFLFGTYLEAPDRSTAEEAYKTLIREQASSWGNVTHWAGGNSRFIFSIRTGEVKGTITYLLKRGHKI